MDHIELGVKIVQIFCTNDEETIIVKLNTLYIFKLDCSNSEKGVEMRRKEDIPVEKST